MPRKAHEHHVEAQYVDRYCRPPPPPVPRVARDGAQEVRPREKHPPQRQKGQGGSEAFGQVRPERPGQVDPVGGRYSQQFEQPPSAPPHQDGDQAGVEQRKVHEETEGIQFGRDEEEGCQESAGPSQQGDGTGVVVQGNQQGGGRNQGHEEKGDRLRHKMVEVESGVDRQVENRHARAGQPLGENGQLTPVESVAAGDQQHAGRSAQDYARGFIQPVVVESIFQEESHGENERQCARTVQQLAAEKNLPLFTGAGPQHVGNPAGRLVRHGFTRQCPSRCRCFLNTSSGWRCRACLRSRYFLLRFDRRSLAFPSGCRCLNTSS